MARSVTGPALIGALVAAITVVAAGPWSTIEAELAGASPGSPRGAAAVIAAGHDHSCAVMRDGDVTCWGRNHRGQLGRGDKIDVGDGNGPTVAMAGPIDLGPGRTAVQVTTGNAHTCVLLDGGDVLCWGHNSSGQLGQGHNINVGDGDGPDVADVDPIDLGPGRSAVQVAAAGRHSCALLDGGEIVCWGRGNYGRLGHDATENVGDGTGPDVADVDPVDLGPGRTATAVAAGNEHTCALLDDHTVKCWGAAEAGALGQGAEINVGDGIGPSVAEIDPVELPGPVVAISGGSAFTCALIMGGDVVCWGRNSDGQLGQGDTDDVGLQPGEVAELEPVDLGPGRSAVAVVAAGNHACALLDGDEVICWGRNHAGQLGQGNTAKVGDGTIDVADIDPIDLGEGRRAIAITGLLNHTCALLDDGWATCWGHGGHGRLGVEDTANIGTSPLDMGGQLKPVDTGPVRRTSRSIRLGCSTPGLLAAPPSTVSSPAMVPWRAERRSRCRSPDAVGFPPTPRRSC
jgi:alpha-tubulin suppressor-like RCC1 family protein